MCLLKRMFKKKIFSKIQPFINKVHFLSYDFKNFKLIFFSSIFIYQLFRNYIYYSPIFRGEIALIEISQVIFLLLNINFILKKKDSFKKQYGIFTTNLKIFFLFFITYEELSFLTANTSKIFQSVNNQSEINLHNLKYLKLILYIPNFF